MNETAGLLADAATRLFEEHLDEATVRRAAAGEWPANAWAAVEAMGLPLALLDEKQGGFGLDPREALDVLWLAGFHACPLPIGETMLANRILAGAGLPLAEGAAAVVPAGAGLSLAREGERWRLAGTARRVPWSDALGTLVVAGDGRVARLAPGDWRVAQRGRNLAGHPRDDVAIDAVVATAPFAGDLLPDAAAIATIQIAGGLDRVLALTVGHVNERVQFGRALAKFQAVQHECAEIAGEVAAAGGAADIAADALARPAGEAVLAIAAAKVRAGEAVGRAVALAHQLHGAIGFTREHRLHLFTTALWSWRDEGGGTVHWSRLLGERALAAGPAGFWPMVTAA